jgi:hypothetical protein
MSDRGRSDTVMASLLETATDAAERARGYLASEEGRRFREKLAGAVIVGAPLISQLPLVRRTALARFLRTAAFAALLVKGAEWLRDWEPAARVVDADR